MTRCRTIFFGLIGAMLCALALITAAGQPTDQPSGDIVVGESILAATGEDEQAIAAANNACTDKAYALERWHMSSTRWDWAYNPIGAPTSVRTGAAYALQRATKVVFGGWNRCNIRVSVPISQAYLGTTTRTAQIASNGDCLGNDRVNVTSWGLLPPGVLARTCTYYTASGRVRGSDTLLSLRYKWSIGSSMPPNCVDWYDLQSVMTHERGHTVGLGHVDQLAHSQQVMSPRTPACTLNKRLLSTGDVAGLKAATALG